jgi:hypothetical protein
MISLIGWKFKVMDGETLIDFNATRGLQTNANFTLRNGISLVS